MTQMIRLTYVAGTKRPYKVEVSGNGPDYTRHVGSEKAAITMANNLARHSKHFGIETEIENAIWEPCEERDLRKGA